MSKLSDTVKKLDVCIDNINKIFIDKMDILEKENKVYRQEVLRLESVVQGLIQVISEKTFPKK